MSFTRRTILQGAIAAALLAASSLPVHAAEVAGIKFPDTVTVAGQELKLNGAGVRTKLVFKVYALGFYLQDKKSTVADVLAACRRFPVSRRGRITFEYVLLAGVNDRPEDARRMARLLAGIKAKVNLIPFNTFPGTKFRRSPAEAIRRFRDLLMQGGVMATIRKTRGDDIDAACGQLRGQVLDRTQVRLGSKLVSVAVRP